MNSQGGGGGGQIGWSSGGCEVRGGEQIDRQTGSQQPISEVVAITTVNNQTLKSILNSGCTLESSGGVCVGAFKTFQCTGFAPNLVDQNLWGIEP